MKSGYMWLRVTGGHGLQGWLPPYGGSHPLTTPRYATTFCFHAVPAGLPRRRRIPRHRLASRFSAPCVALSRALAARIRNPAGRTRDRGKTKGENKIEKIGVERNLGGGRSVLKDRPTVTASLPLFQYPPLLITYLEWLVPVLARSVQVAGLS